MSAVALNVLLPELEGKQGALVPRHMTLDSRDVELNDLFCAIPGAASDGRNFIDAALAHGACAVLAEANGLTVCDERVLPVKGLAAKLPQLAKTFYGDPSSQMALIAVTGTNGKTSTVQFCAQLLRALGVATGTIGTLGSSTDNTFGGAKNTSPDVISLNRQLALWSEQGVDHVALEASSHALDQGRLSGVSINTAVFTNVSRDHLDYHGTEDAYAEAKLKLFAEFDLKHAIYNADDAQASKVANVAQCASMGISLKSAESDVYVQVLSEAPSLVFRIHSPFGSREVTTALAGSFNAFNAAAAIMAVTVTGYPFAAVVDAAETLQATPGRMQLVPSAADADVIVDYAHTPDALERALSALKSEGEGKLWVVFGCGGDRDVGKRPIMGRIATRLADVVVVTSDNPRSEVAEAICEQIVDELEIRPTVIVDRREAIDYALRTAASGDVVLVAGKGHEDYQEINGERYPFSDIDIIASFAKGVAK